jgi:hypothetical protein
MTAERPGRSPVVAMVLAGVALVLAATATVVVVVRRGGDDAPAARGRPLIEGRATAGLVVEVALAETRADDGEALDAVEAAALGLVPGRSNQVDQRPATGRRRRLAQ